MLRARACLLAAASFAAAAAPARAQEAAPPPPAAIPLVPAHRPLARLRVKLDYRRGTGAGACADASTLRSQVQLRLLYDPFEPDSDGTPAGVARVELRGTAGGFAGRYVYSEGGRDRTASFDVPGATWAHCGVLVQNLAIVGARRSGL